jgi:hypothetical protein
MSPHYNVVRLNTRSASAMSVCKALRYRNSIGTPNHYCTKVPLRIENPTMSKMFLEDGRGLRGCRAAYLRVNSGRLSGHLAFSQSRQACSQAQSCNPTPSSPQSDIHADTWSSAGAEQHEGISASIYHPCNLSVAIAPGLRCGCLRSTSTLSRSTALVQIELAWSRSMQN